MWVCWPLTYRWCVGCTHNEQGTPALPWLGEHVGLGKVLHVAALVTDSNEASLELERCQSSTGLQVKNNHRYTRQIRFNPLLICMLRPTRQGRFTYKKTETSNCGCSMVESQNQVKNIMCTITLVQVSWSLPVTGLSRRSVEDGLRISAKNL